MAGETETLCSFGEQRACAGRRNPSCSFGEHRVRRLVWMGDEGPCARLQSKGCGGGGEAMWQSKRPRTRFETGGRGGGCESGMDKRLPSCSFGERGSGHRKSLTLECEGEAEGGGVLKHPRVGV